METDVTDKRAAKPVKKVRSYAVSARAVRMAGAKMARDPKKAKSFLMEIGVVDAEGKLAVGFK